MEAISGQVQQQKLRVEEMLAAIAKDLSKAMASAIES